MDADLKDEVIRHHHTQITYVETMLAHYKKLSEAQGVEIARLRTKEETTTDLLAQAKWIRSDQQGKIAELQRQNRALEGRITSAFELMKLSLDKDTEQLQARDEAIENLVQSYQCLTQKGVLGRVVTILRATEDALELVCRAYEQLVKDWQ